MRKFKGGAFELGGLRSWNLSRPVSRGVKEQDDGPQLNKNGAALVDPACQEKEKIIGTGFLAPPISIPEAAAAVAVAAIVAPGRLLWSDLKDASKRPLLSGTNLAIFSSSSCHFPSNHVAGRGPAVLPHLTSALCGPDVVSLPTLTPRFPQHPPPPQNPSANAAHQKLLVVPSLQLQRCHIKAALMKTKG